MLITESMMLDGRKLLLEQGASANDIEFAARVWRGGITRYQSRLSALGIENASVLDAGCGFGQWAIAMLALGNRVTAIDLDPLRIMFLKSILKSSPSIGESITVETGSIDNLNYPNDSFDWVFCYGSIFLSNWRRSIHEFYRVLRPDGFLYVTTNDWNWYRYLWEREHNSNESYDAKAAIIRALSSSLHYERSSEYDGNGQLIISHAQMIHAAQQLDFEIQYFGEEGTAVLKHTEEAPVSFLPDDLIGLGAVNEYVLRKVPQVTQPKSQSR